MDNLILASASPRRRELMSLLPFDFTVVAKQTDELASTLLSPQENAMRLACDKAKAVHCNRLQSYVIGCDTIVALDDEVLGKPNNPEHACKMLQLLSGREHMVYTGVYIAHTSGSVQFYEGTRVKFRTLSMDEITRYVGTGEPMDKAGSYGIQGKAAIFVERINGDYFNVVGLPIAKLYTHLLQMGIEPK